MSAPFENTPRDSSSTPSSSVALSTETAATAVTEGTPSITVDDRPISATLIRLAPLAARYICTEPDCIVSFTQQRRLQNHMKKHNIHTCETCRESYPHKKSLREHEQSKHEGKRYKCDVKGCNKSVAQKRNLARHKAMKHRLQSGDDLHMTVPSFDPGNLGYVKLG